MKDRYYMISFTLPTTNCRRKYIEKLVYARSLDGAIRAVQAVYPKAENIQDSTIYTPC